LKEGAFYVAEFFEINSKEMNLKINYNKKLKTSFRN
jgi:hypothetical protein